jgi:enamine deaminase RidA (YjgF/YER057c/UK114 family)
MHFAHIRRAAPLLVAALALTATAAPTAAFGANPPKETLMPEDAEGRAFQEAYGFSDAVVHGDTIHLSGVVAGPAPGETSLEPGYTRAFERIDGILKRLGVTWDDVLVFDTFHKGSVSAQVEALLPVKNRYIKAPFPTWTAVGVSDLYSAGAVTEIRLVVRKR